MRLMWMGAGAMLLAGCATSSDLYSSPIDQTAISTKSLDDLTRCLEVKFDTAHTTMPSGERSVVIKNGYRNTIGLLVLTPQTDGVRVDYRRANGLVGAGDWKSCT